MKKRNYSFSQQNVKHRHLTEEEINSPEFDPDEFAPAPESDAAGAAARKISDRRSSLFFAVLCAACALIIALVGTLTSYASGKSVESIRKKQVLSLFENCSSASFYEEKDGSDVYVVYYKSRLAGYAVFVTEDGFSDEIEILVGVDATTAVSGVVITDENESGGLGDKITKRGFLSQFDGLTAEMEDADLDLVSCATVSSRAVQAGVNRVIAMRLNLDAIAKELGVETITGDEIAEEIRKEEEDKNSSDTTKADVDTGELDSTEFGGDEHGQNNNLGGESDNVDGQDVTTVYETETTKTDDADTTDGETTADTTQAPAETTARPADTTAAPITTAPETTAPETTAAPDTTAVPEETTGESAGQEG